MPRDQLVWWLLGVALLGVAAFVAYNYLPWIVFGLFVYYVARPITRRLEPRLGSSSLAAATTILLLVVPFVAFVAAFFVVALGQISNALAGVQVQAFVDQLPFEVPTPLPSTPESVYETAVVLAQDPSVQSTVGAVSGTVGVIGATVYNVNLSILLAFFLLVSDRRLAGWFTTEIFGTDSLAIEYFRGLDAGFRSVYFGYTLTIVAIMLLTALLYTLFNTVAPAGIVIPSVVLLAVVTGIFTLVPLVGRSIVYFFIAALLGIQATSADPRLLWYPVVFLLVMGVAFDNLVRTYIRPSLSGRVFATGLVMFAYLLGPGLFGWYGIFLGPLLLVVSVVFMRRVLPTLAHPERERTAGTAQQTLDGYAETRPLAGDPPADTETGGKSHT